MKDFLAMGGYAAFVWPAYAISIGALGAMIVFTLRSYVRAKQKLSALHKGERL